MEESAGRGSASLRARGLMWPLPRRSRFTFKATDPVHLEIVHFRGRTVIAGLAPLPIVALPSGGPKGFGADRCLDEIVLVC